ncbi:MAG: hypothetical protein L0207_06825 [Chlamydiae bacterium]|nr:hypothetical protein [Chlamydiota bacterium]
MSDFQKPINRLDKIHDEHIIVPPVEKEKKDREELQKEPEKLRDILFATIFGYLKNLFDSFTSKGKIEGKIINYTIILEDLYAFKLLLFTLGNEDQSKNPKFAQDLSELWHKLLEDCNNIEILERKNLKDVSQFKEILSLIKDYPYKEEHSLGYYLIEHVGEDWLPFPYMEILLQLHLEFQNNPKQSHLKKWIDYLDTLIADIEKKVKFPTKKG